MRRGGSLQKDGLFLAQEQVTLFSTAHSVWHTAPAHHTRGPRINPAAVWTDNPQTIPPRFADRPNSQPDHVAVASQPSMPQHHISITVTVSPLSNHAPFRRCPTLSAILLPQLAVHPVLHTLVAPPAPLFILVSSLPSSCVPMSLTSQIPPSHPHTFAAVHPVQLTAPPQQCYAR